MNQGGISVTLLGLPYDASSTYLAGPALAPDRIREALASTSSNAYAEAGARIVGAANVLDAGDVAIGETTARADIERAVAEEIESETKVLSLGGDHSVTYPILRAFRTRHPRLTVVQFDAHGDLYDDFEGERYSHASPFARAMEEGLMDRLVQIGIRTLTPHLREQAERFGVEIIEMRDLSAVERLVFSNPVYVSFDLDALDPSCAPGVSHHEPGGLGTRQALEIIQGLDATIVGADVVELNPHRDPLGMTAMVAAKLVKELAARMLEG